MSAPDATTTAAIGPPCPNCGVPNRPGARFCRSCGAALVNEQPPVPTLPEVPVPTGTVRPAWTLARLSAAARGLLGTGRNRWRRLSRRTRRLVAGGLALALVLTGGGYVVIQNVFYSPDEPVRHLFAALEAKDAGQLHRYMDCDPLCQPGALSVGYVPPTQLQIMGMQYGQAAEGDVTRRPNMGDAVVRVRYQLGGATYDDSVGVSRNNAGLLRPWGISSPPGAWLDVVSNSLDMAKVAAATVKTIAPLQPGSARKQGEAWAPPGIYTVSGRQSVLFGSTPVQVTIAGTSVSRQEVKLDLAVKPTVVDEVTRQVHRRIDDCAALADFNPKTDRSSILSNCPFWFDAPYTETQGIKWTVLDYPRIELQLGDDQSVTVHTTAPGHARVDYAYSFQVIPPQVWTPTSASVDINVKGSVVEDGGNVVWSFP